MKKAKSKNDYLNKIFVKNGKYYKVFDVDMNSEMISARNLEKSKIVVKETFKKFDDNYKYFGG